MARRARGEGSWWRLADGRWKGYVPVSQHGRSRRVYRQAKSLRELREKLQEVRRWQLENRIPEPGSASVALADWVQTWFDAWKARKERSPNTVEAYRAAVQRIVAFLGARRLMELSGDDIDAFYTHLAGQGLAMKTRRLTHVVLRQALVAAVRKKRLPANPLDEAVSVPAGGEDGEPRIFTPGQLRRFLEAAKRVHYGLALWIGAKAGLRVAEVAGLRWRDVDLERRLLRVRQQLVYHPGAGLLPEALKTPASRRDVPVPQDLVDWLARERFAREIVDEESLVILSPLGKPAHTARIDAAVKAACRHGGLPEEFTFHDLRHTYATMLAEGGVPIKKAAALLGHADIRTTLKYYVRIWNDDHRDVYAAVDRYLSLDGEARPQL